MVDGGASVHPLSPLSGVWDRAAGVLVAQAWGDALGVPYEFGPRLAESARAEMIGGGLGDYAPGEWSDDTQMSVCIARVSAQASLDPASAGGAAALDAVAAGFEEWGDGGPADMGIQTRRVLADAAALPGSPGARLRAAGSALHAATGRTAGNGALMRTGVVGLVALADREATARAAVAVAELTHPDPLAAESCVLWSEAVRVAVSEQRLDVRAGLDLLSAQRRAPWLAWIEAAEADTPPANLQENGFTVTAFQAAWRAIYVSGPDVEDVLQAAIHIGGDTDTVAAIAGALIGAYRGASAVPDSVRSLVHGWPGLSADDLAALAVHTAQRGLAR